MPHIQSSSIWAVGISEAASKSVMCLAYLIYMEFKNLLLVLVYAELFIFEFIQLYSFINVFY